MVSPPSESVQAPVLPEFLKDEEILFCKAKVMVRRCVVEGEVLFLWTSYLLVTILCQRVRGVWDNR